MAGLFIFDSKNPDVGFSTADNLALNVFLDILNDVLYYTDGSKIYQWEGGSTDKAYIWRSRKVRLPHKINLGAARVEAESYVDVVFKLYADGVLKHTETVANDEVFRLPGGYLSNIYEFELTGTDVVTGVSLGASVFDLATG